MRQLLISLTRSTSGASKKQLGIIQALGLKKIGDCVLHEYNDAILGMINKIPHLIEADEVDVEIEEVEEEVEE